MELEQACKRLLIKSPFYGLFMLGLNKYYDDGCSTICICRKGINTEIAINKNYWDSLNDDDQIAVLTHQVMHICFKHMTMRKEFEVKYLFDRACDCEANSYIPLLQRDEFSYAGLWSLQDKLGVKEYYKVFSEGNYNFIGTDSYGSLNDSHESWKDFEQLSDAEETLVHQQIDYIARNVAEQVRRTAGTIPGELAIYIDSLFQIKPQVFNWKAYFRRLLGTAIVTSVRKTRRKESRRFEGSPGLRNSRKHNILVAIDTSGSVSTAELADFFSEINYIYKAGANVDLIEFDTCIRRTYKYTGTWDGTCTGRGGTSFTAPIQYYNDHRKEYCTFVLFTDGYASVNVMPAKEMVWIITSNGSRSSYPGKVIHIPNE